MNNPITFNEQMIGEYFNLQPSEVKGRANGSTEHYRRMLYTKLYSVFKFELPANIPLNFFRYFLFHFGSIAVVNTDKFGWIAQPYGIEKIGLYYQPKVITVANPFLESPISCEIGKNAEIIRLMDDYYGLDSLVTRYAEKLANIDKAIDIAIMNSNISIGAEAESKKDAEAIKEAYAEATTGKPLVVMNNRISSGKRLEPLLKNVSGNYILDKLIDSRRGIMNCFLTEIGIKNANIDKRERLNTDEVNQNNEETKAIVTVIEENLKICMDKVNALTGLDFSVELRYDDIDLEEVDA